MKKMTTLAMISVMVMGLSACGKKGVDPQEQVKQKETEAMKVTVPSSEIVAKVRDTNNVYIHRFYDEKNGTTCYFLDYHYDSISCVK